MSSPDFHGILEIDPRGFGTVRAVSREYRAHPDDVRVSANLVARYGLREGCLVSGAAHEKSGHREVARLDDVNGMSPEQYAQVLDLTRQTAVAPDARIVLETRDVTGRVIDLICPIGRGQRALIVSPPRAGKTVMLQRIAEAIARNERDIELLLLLVDERPEEVTEMERAVRAKVFASSNDRDFRSHARIARLTLEYAKRQTEVGRDVVILLDSLTRLGRVYNTGIRGSGKILSGGIDARALEIPKRIFGASRNIEHGGSLTIVATILVDTGSRMDELIFQEFKGTGNSEIVLDRELADHRVFPAINIALSGTRREELLLGDDVERHYRLRRALMDVSNRDAMQALLDLVRKTRDNRELLGMLDGSLTKDEFGEWRIPRGRRNPGPQ